MASAQVVETSVNNNSPSQDSNHPDDLFQSKEKIVKQVMLGNGSQTFGKVEITIMSESTS